MPDATIYGKNDHAPELIPEGCERASRVEGHATGQGGLLAEDGAGAVRFVDHDGSTWEGFDRRVVDLVLFDSPARDADEFVMALEVATSLEDDEDR